MTADESNVGSDRPKRYVGYIWLEHGPGIRLELEACSASEAVTQVEAEYGKGHAFSIWNEEDASKQRGTESQTSSERFIE